MGRLAVLAALVTATTASAQTPPAKLKDVTMSADATRRAHLQEITLDAARKLADACVAFSRAASPNGGATRVGGASGGDEECGHGPAAPPAR
jgi:hypothetical protein